MLDQEGLGQLLTGLHGRSLADDLPYRASTTEYFFHAVELLDRRRLIDETRFVSLQALPAGKHRAIAAVARIQSRRSPRSAIVSVGQRRGASRG